MKPPLVLAAGASLLLAVLAGACMTPDQIMTLQKDVSDMRGELEAMRKENRATAASLEAIKESVASKEGGSLEQTAETKRQIETVRDDIRALSSRVEEMQHDLGLLAASSHGARAPLQPGPPPPSTGAPYSAGGAEPAAPPRAASAPPAGNPDDLFNAAYADYSKGNYTPAQIGFETYIKQYPATEKSDDALYWIGLCHYDQGEYAEGIETFDKLIQTYPNGDKIPGAHLKKGLSLLEMNRTAQGVVQLQYLLERFPRSEEARIARDRLREIGVKP